MKKVAICLIATSLTLLMITSQGFGAGDLTKGKTVYEAFCVGCHGPHGTGNGPESAALNPKPTNLTDASVTANLIQQDVERAVLMGKPDTAMKGFGSLLTKEDVENLLAYVSNLMGK